MRNAHYSPSHGIRSCATSNFPRSGREHFVIVRGLNFRACEHRTARELSELFEERRLSFCPSPQRQATVGGVIAPVWKFGAPDVQFAEQKLRTCGPLAGVQAGYGADAATRKTMRHNAALRQVSCILVERFSRIVSFPLRTPQINTLPRLFVIYCACLCWTVAPAA